MDNTTKGRRRFVKTCLATATAVAANPAMLASAEPVRAYRRSLLVDQHGKPVRSVDIESHQAFIFHYPYVTTPCFLINIDRPLETERELLTATEGSYTWHGGTGPDKNIVAFSAICAHKLSYPTRTLSFLNYRPGRVRFVSRSEEVEERSQLIYCCSERSAYDPAQGAEVLGGPATQPLAAVELEYDIDNDRYFAVGMRGGTLFDPFFEKFGFRIALEHKITDIRASVEEKTAVYSHEDYSSHSVSC